MRVNAEPVEIKLTYGPNAKQIEFHSHPAKYRCFGGGWGNGKTDGGCAEAFALSMEYPGTEGLIARKTRPELKATTQNQFFNGTDGPEGSWTGCPQEAIRSFNKTEGKLTFINGSVIHFWPLDEPQKLSNLNLGWFLIDQAEEVAEDMFMMLEGRLRRANSPLKGILLCNPNGHDWIWRRFIYLEYPGYGYIHATTYDNANLPPEYLKSLKNLPEAWYKRFVEGSFDVFEGQIWPEFDPEIHTLNPMPHEDWWEIVEAGDHGRRNPTAWLWMAFFRMYGHDYCYIIDEHYEAGKLVGYHAQKVLEKREIYGYPQATILDASAAAEDANTGRSVMDEYWDYGISCTPSDRHPPARINRVAEWFRLDPSVPHPLTGDTRPEGWPRAYIFKNCQNLIEHTQQYQWKKKPVTQDADAQEKPLQKDDHDVDAMGYGFMSRPAPGLMTSLDNEGPNSWYWRIIRERAEGRGKGSHSTLGSEA